MCDAGAVTMDGGRRRWQIRGHRYGDRGDTRKGQRGNGTLWIASVVARGSMEAGSAAKGSAAAAANRDRDLRAALYGDSMMAVGKECPLAGFSLEGSLDASLARPGTFFAGLIS